MASGSVACVWQRLQGRQKGGKLDGGKRKPRRASADPMEAVGEGKPELSRWASSCGIGCGDTLGSLHLLPPWKWQRLGAKIREAVSNRWDPGCLRLTAVAVVVWPSGLVAVGCGSEFYFSLWPNHCPFVFSVYQKQLNANLLPWYLPCIFKAFDFASGIHFCTHPHTILPLTQ